jgi:hypothetical protein
MSDELLHEVVQNLLPEKENLWAYDRASSLYALPDVVPEGGGEGGELLTQVQVTHELLTKGKPRMFQVRCRVRGGQCVVVCSHCNV